MTAWYNRNEERSFRNELQTILPSEEKQMALKIVTRWMEEGIEQGMTRVVLRQLESRFGALPAAMETAVRHPHSEDPEQMADSLLGFAALSDLEKWPADRVSDSP